LACLPRKIKPAPPPLIPLSFAPLPSSPKDNPHLYIKKHDWSLDSESKKREVVLGLELGVKLVTMSKVGSKRK
jgi:hypothetical protein